MRHTFKRVIPILKFSNNSNLLTYKTIILQRKMFQSTLQGVWNGYIVNGLVQTLLVFNFLNSNNETKGYLDVPSQSVKKLPINRIEIQNDLIVLNLTTIGSIYSGRVVNETFISGIWKQNGYELSLNLEKIKNISDYNVNRPQTPVRPFSYMEEEVKIINKEANVTLAGTLTYPIDSKPIAYVIMAHGSGGHDRDETIFEHKPFMVIADYLTKHNIAVLRFDERGIAQSTGDFKTAADIDFANDVFSAIKYLRMRNQNECIKIGIMGHSKGGLTAMLTRRRTNLVKFIVLLGSPGVNGEEVVIEQNALVSRVQNMSEEMISRNIEINRVAFEIVKRETNPFKIVEEINDYFDKKTANMSVSEKNEYEVIKTALINQIPLINSPWFRSFLIFEPKSVLETLKIPILGLWGSNDLQVSAKQNLIAVENALNQAKNRKYKLLELNGLNHLFQNSSNGNPSEYENIEETFSPVALDIIEKWIQNAILKIK